MATLHVVSGKAGSGKTTLARRLGRELPAIVICEDEWLSKVAPGVSSLADYVRSSAQCRSVIEPLTSDLLRLGTSVVFDFAGNTVRDRQWAVAIARRAAADVIVHYLPADEDSCKARIHQRNETKPEGVYFGHVTDDLFDAVTRYFQEPAREEGFAVVTHALD